MGRNRSSGDWMHFNCEKLKGFGRYCPILLIVFISFIIRMYLRSNYLDDWDSVQFALALDNYSIALHQPHPPGYPVYVFLGRLLHLVFPNVTDSLVYLSILFGTLSIIAIYLLAKKFFGEIVGVMSALMLSFTPAHLEFSDVAMSDIVSLFFIIVTIYLLYLSMASKNYLYLASISLGITVGVRQTDLLLVPLYFVFLIYHRNDLKACILSILLLSLSVCAWLVPTIIDTGLNTFIDLQRSQGAYAVNASTLNLLGGLSLSNLAETIGQLMILLTSGWSMSLLLFSALTLIYFVYNWQKVLRSYMDMRILILAYLFLAYFVFSVFYYQLYIVRYLLPLFVPLVIIISYALVKLIQSSPNKLSRSLLVVIIIACFIFMGSQAISNGYSLHVSKPAPVLASDYITMHFLPDEVIIIVGDSFRHLQYYLPSYNVVFWDNFKPSDVLQYISFHKTVLTDIDMSFRTVPDRYLEFSRDRSIYSKHILERLYQYRWSNGTKAIALPDVFHDNENWSGILTRWMQADATLIVITPENRTFNLSLNALSFYRNRTLELYTGDEMAGRVAVPTYFINVSIPIHFAKGVNTVRLNVPEGCERPCDKPELNNPDYRCLSVAVQNFTVT